MLVVVRICLKYKSENIIMVINNIDFVINV